MQYRIDQNLSLKDLYIAPIIIQPIIENSFKHGFLHKETAGNLVIEITLKENYLYCIVEDDGVGRTAAQSYNTLEQNKQRKSSTKIIRERLYMLNESYGYSTQKKQSLVTDLPHNSGTRTEIWIPMIKYDNDE